MKTLGLDIVIGATIGTAIKSIDLVTNSTKFLGATIEKLNNKKINVLENNTEVKKFTDKISALDKTIEHLYQKKKDLQLKKSLAKTDAEAKKINEELKATNKKISILNHQKLHLKDELEKTKQKALETNKTLKRIGSTIESLNNRKIKIQTNIDKRDKLKGKALDTIAIGASIAAPFKAGIEFESEMARVKALSGATNDEFKKLQDTAKKLGSTTVFSASEAAQGMQFLAMAGFKTNEITKAMPGLLNLASAGQTDLATTADITSNILSGFGIKADKTGHVADVLAKAMTTANVDVQMLGETMKYVAPAASGLGASLEEVTTLTAKLGDVGIQASNAGTALRSMYLRMASPPSEARKTIAKLGLTTKDANGKFVGMINIIKQLQEKTKGLSNTQIAGIMKNLFGTEATSAATALLKVPTKELKKYEKSLIKADGTAKKIAKTQTDTVSGSFKALGSALEGVSIAFSSLFLPAIKSATDGITWITQKINGLISEHKTLATIIGGAIAGFGVLTVASFALAYAGTFVANAWHKLGIVYSLVRNATLLLATTEGRATVQTKLLSFWSGILNTKAKLVTFSKTAWALATSTLSKSMGFLGTVLRFVGNGILWLGRALMANPIGLAITVIAGGAYLIYSNWDKLKKWFGSFWNGISSHFKSGMKHITNIFLHPINTIQKYWHKLIGWISEKLKWITSIGSKIKGFFGFGDSKDAKLNIKPVVDKVKPIVASAALATTATATPITQKAVQIPKSQVKKVTLQPVPTQSIQNITNTHAPSTTNSTNTQSSTIVYNFNFGGIKVETKDGKIANPQNLKEEIKKVIEEIDFDNKQRSLSDVV